MTRPVPLHGVIPPAITPFKEDGQVDLETFERLVEFWSRHVQGLFVCGTYGSGPLLAAEERKQVAEAAIRAARGRFPIIVHVGSTATATSVDLARHAESAGAVAVAAVPPYYYSHQDEAVKRHFGALVKAVSLPVYVYNNPKTVGYAVSPTLLAQLADLGVRGVKDSSFDVLYYSEIRAAVGVPGFDFVAGSEALMLACWLAGARAFIAGLANCLPEPVGTLYDLLARGRYEPAAKQQEAVRRLRGLLQRGGSIPMVHAVLGIRGIASGFPRAPFQSAPEGLIAETRLALEKTGLRLGRGA